MDSQAQESYRPLEQEEIHRLERQGCSAEDWSRVRVAPDFTPDSLVHVRLFGEIRLGSFNKAVRRGGTLSRPGGIRYAELHDVTVGNNCLIEHIGSYIAGYDIDDDCCISHTGIIEMNGTSRFGNGTEIPVLQETGGKRMLTLHRQLTAQEAYLMVTRPAWSRNVWHNAVLQAYPPETRGRIGRSARIVNTGTIRNVRLGEGADIDGALVLSDTTLDSLPEAPSSVGVGCIVRSSLIAPGAQIADGAKVERCRVGEAVHIGSGFTATDSVFFANSHMENGEACSVVAGPFTVSHHKSTLLIGCMLSFANLGSGTNMSNHLYKAGPLHYGIMNRGDKTASNAHLVWPARVGAFSMIMGKVAEHVDATMFPFSYLFGEEGGTRLVPGVNSMTLGTFRDIGKWPERDRRPVSCRSDLIVFDLFHPAVVTAITQGLSLLHTLLHNAPEADSYTYGGMKLSRKAIERGIVCYERLLTVFWGEYYLNPCKTTTGKEVPPADYAQGWEDALGVPLPHSVLEETIARASHSPSPLRVLHEELEAATSRYGSYLHQWQHSEYGLPDEKVREYAGHYEEALSEWEAALLADLEKEKRTGDVPSSYAEEIEERIRTFFREKKHLYTTIKQ